MSFFVGILGELEVRINNRAVAVPQGKQQLLLTALTLRCGQFASTDQLVDLLWADQAPPSARTTLRGYVKRLRKRLDSSEVVIEALPAGYRLVANKDDVDLYRFRRIWRDARGCDEPAEELAMVRTALALWRGRALNGLDTLPWVSEVAAGLDEEWLQVVERRSELEIDTGSAQATAIELRRVLAQHPYRESLWCRLIVALHRSGRSAEALMTYEDVRAMLADKLGVDPSGPLRAVHQQVLTEEASHGGPATSAHRAVAAQPVFIGREKHLAAMDGLLEGSGRPATLVVDGPAGVGKTALVRYWADRVADRFPAGRVSVDLRGLDPDGPLSPVEALAELLVAAGTPPGDVPDGLPARAAAFQEMTAGRPMLVVLDDAHDVEQIRPLLPAPAGLAVITSQRQMRGLVVRDAARRLSVPRMTPDEGRDLVAAIGGRPLADSHPAAVRELVELCAGLPLALRIVLERLSRIPDLSLPGLVRELCAEHTRLDLLETGDDEAASVRRVLSRPLSVLARAERELMCRLAHLGVSEFDLDDVVWLARGEQVGVQRTLSRLVAVNLLVQRSSRRYHLHDLQRVVARESLLLPAFR